MADEAIADPKNASQPEVTLRKRAQTESFILNIADGKPRVEATDNGATDELTEIGRVSVRLPEIYVPSF